MGAMKMDYELRGVKVDSAGERFGGRRHLF
jgi:hypothetical protein